MFAANAQQKFTADCDTGGESRHLAALRSAGIVTAQKTGREVRYSLDCAALAGVLRDLADALEACHDQCCGTEES